MSRRPIRVLIVEDHPIYRDGLRTALDSLDGIDVVGEASTAEEAVDAVARRDPNVVLMDLDLGDSSGIELTARITAARPEVAVLILTMHDAESLVFAALCAGACGYLLKDIDREELAGAIGGAAAGEAVFGAGIARRVLARMRNVPPASEPAQDQMLTGREREILDLMAEGWGNQDIAGRLFLSPKTVRNNVSTILAKLHSASRGEAIVQARKWGYGSGADA